MITNVLLANMACLADFGDPNRRYQRFLQNGRPAFRNLIESILLFDKIVIPTNDFMPLGLLLGVLGAETTTRLLTEDVIKFARFPGFVGYVGNGGGISVNRIKSPDNETWLGESASTEEVLEWLVAGVPTIRDKRKLRDLGLRSTIEFSLQDNNVGFAKVVYDQVAQIPDVLSGYGWIELNRLPGIKPNEVRILGTTLGSDREDDISQVLRVARACIEARAAQVAGCDDIYTSDQVGKLFQKGFRVLAERAKPSGSYEIIKKLAGLPDVGELALQHTSIIEDLLRLRSSASGAQFRSWFHEKCRTENAEMLAREYASVLKSVPFIGKSGPKTIRFATQVGLAALMLPFDPLVGLATGATVGAIDTFLVERIFKGATPKIFLEQLANTARSPELAQQA